MLNMPWQQCCHGMCKISFWFSSFNLSNSQLTVRISQFEISWLFSGLLPISFQSQDIYNGQGLVVLAGRFKNFWFGSIYIAIFLWKKPICAKYSPIPNQQLGYPNLRCTCIKFCCCFLWNAPQLIRNQDIYNSSVKNLENHLQVRQTSYFWALWSFQMFTGPLFQIILHLLSTALLSGFQSSLGALKSTE